MNRSVFENIPAVTPLCASQEGVYLECVNNPASVRYNLPFRFTFPQGTEEARLCDAVKQALCAHPALFVTFGTPAGVPSMLFSGVGEVEIPVKEAGDLAAFVRPFDLENGPLFRAEIWKTGEGLTLVLDVHHLVFDGTSAGVLARDIAAAYAGRELLPEEMSQFDVAAAEKAVSAEERAADLAYFEKQLGGDEWDTGFVSDVTVEPAGSPLVMFTEPCDGLSEADVAAFAKAVGVSENALFTGAFAYTLAKFNGVKDSCFCTAHNGRLDKRLQNATGMFVHTLPLRFAIDEAQSVGEFLKTVYNGYYETKKRTAVGFGELAKEYGVTNEATFVFQSSLFDAVPFAGGEMTVDYVTADEAITDFDMMVMKTETGYKTELHAKRALFTEGFLRAFSATYRMVVSEMMKKSTLGEIAFVSDTASVQLDALNKTEAAYNAHTTVVEEFRAQAQKTPDNLCLCYLDKHFTYREVDEFTDRFARYLVEHGIGKETVVGVLIGRCEYMLLCSLSVLKAGGAYLPLDPTYPAERLNLMVQDSGATMLLYAPEYADVITADFTGARICIDDIPALDGNAALPTPAPEDLFVMLYTSGSTGTPKGVQFAHSNTLVTTEWVKKYYEMNETSRVTSYASYGFDANVFDTYPAITSGACLHIIAEEMRLDFPALLDYYNQNGITHTVMTTQVGRQFALMGGQTTLKHLSVAGEKLTPLPAPTDFALYNLYGPTEGSVVTSGFKMEAGVNYKDVPIGAAVDNLKVYVVDPRGRRLPVGAVGELWIAGPHVTRGYLNRPEKTAEAYGDNPFSNEAGYERVYRTGDIVRLLSDGNLQFVGRRDGQVKVRGFRVELTEIEEIVRRFPDVEDATVAAFDDPAGGKFVAAYIVSPTQIDKTALADFIRAEKPPYMVPAVVMQIDKIPLNQNQKVNKRALPVPVRDRGEIVPPKTEMQQKIFDIVADVVGHKDFGVTTDFDTAGLTSIGAVRLNVALADAFDTPIRLSDLKEQDTVEKLEAFLGESEGATAYEMQADYPITENQNGIFVECMAKPDSTMYNIPVLIKLSDNVELPRLAEAVKAALSAHPYVKTTLFTDEKGDVRARRRDEAAVNVPLIECATLPDKTELVKPFTLLDGELFRVAIYKTNNGNALFMDFHHILCDGTSEAVLLDAISRAYAGETLKPETFSGFEAALEEQNVRASDRYTAAQEFWKTALAGAETDCMPKKEPSQNADGSGAVTVLSDVDAAALKAYCDKNNVTMNALFNAAFALVLSKFTGKESVSFATIYSGRADSRLANAVMFLARSLPIAADVDGETDALDFVKAMQTKLKDSMANDACSFAELSHDYGVKSDIILAFQGDQFRFDSLCGEPAEIAPITLGEAKSPLSVNVNLTADGFTFEIEYRRDTYNEKFAKALANALSAALAAFVGGGKLSALSLMNDEAWAAYDRLNDNAMPIENVFFHERVEQWAEKQPDNVAVVAEGRSLTFRELNEQANRVAHALLSRGVKKDTIAGLVLERSCEVLVGEIGMMKAGVAFLPMLPSYPDERIDFCLQNAGSPYVLTTEAIKAAKPELFSADKPYQVLTVEDLLKTEQTDNPHLTVDPTALAYCIYTSGSTGTPKGVMIEQRNLQNYLQAHMYTIGAFSHDEWDGRTLALSSISFDMSLHDLFLPLFAGRGVVLATEDEQHNPLSLRDLMVENNVQVMCCTPSFMNNIVSIPEFKPAIKNLKTITVGAEAFPPALYDALKAVAPELQIINGYGPTEATICCATKELQSGFGITIGKPTKNTKFYVVDKAGNVLPPYGIGELIICGVGVGRGYVKLPEKTAASFFTLLGLPAYHSGDQVRLNGDAEIDFGGRIDNQVKLRGFRVELDEIENVMTAYPAVKQAKVLMRNNGTEDYLAGFFTATETVDVAALTAHMKERLTYYMVPAVLMQLSEMPLTPNGKIDKNGFPETTKTKEKKAGRRAAKKSLEQRLCEIFADILGEDEIYADDNFFELGGTSLSASKVTMVLMSDGIEVKYGDIFDHPSPEELADFIEQRDRAAQTVTVDTAVQDEEIYRPALQYNTVKYAEEVKRESLGNVLLTGATGFLGVHVLKELLDIEDGHIYCLVRRGKHESAEKRLRMMLVYYFSNGFDEAFKNRITVLEADITDETLGDKIADLPIDTVINCAACVKHFADDDILDRINVRGVENLIAICKPRNLRLVQVSTVSVPGIHTKESYEKQLKMYENQTFIIDDMDNKYILSKRAAELKMMDAIEDGLRGKIVRVGNLMGRHSDGEFQANMETNMFLSGIRGFAVMGKYPISHMTDPMSFSPIDCTARAVVLLSGTNDKFTAFNANNRYGFDEMKIIDACNRNGIKIYPEMDEQYYKEFREKLGDDRFNSKLGGLAAYDIKDGHAVDVDNLFTTNILYRIGFSWPLVDDAYLDRAIESIMSLDYFNIDEIMGAAEADE